jgi:diguanylate cyclase (GGDEF)-like protein
MTHAQLLVAVIFMQQALFGAVWLGAVRLRISAPAARHWAAATWLTAASMLLIEFRGQASIWLTVVLANVLLISSFVVLRRGVQVFARSQPTDREHRLVLSAGAAAVLISAATNAPMMVFLLVVSSTLAFILLRNASEVRRLLAGEFGERAAWLCALPLAAIGVLNMIRVVVAPLAVGAFAPSISEAGLGNTGLMFATMLFGLVLNGTLVAMVFTRMVRRLEYQSDHDALTGLLGRRPLERLLRAEAARHARTGRSYALLSIDIDHFKRINDRHGHAVGDVVLARVAQTLQARSREGDSVARMGGEEFCALLPDADLAGAQQAGQRMLEAVRQLPHPEAGNALQVTVSIGLAVAQGEGETVEDLLLRVDRALYAAKQAGRDRIVLAGPAESLAPV